MLQTPWLTTYEKLGIQVDQPADLTLADYVHQHARDRPDTSALHYFTRSWTYAQVDAETNRITNALRRLGVGRGDVVGFHMPNIPQYYLGLIAVSKLGAIGSGVSPLLAPPELAHQISDAKIKVLMSFEALGPAVDAMSAPDCLDSVIICGGRDTLDAPDVVFPTIGDVKTMSFSEAMYGASPEFETIKVEPTDTFMIQYTGGTTGKPKGAMLSHRTLLHNPVQTLALAPKVRKGDETFVTAFPLFHIAGLCFGLMAVMTGGSYECLPDPRDTDRICDVLKARPVTRFAAVPALYDMLVANPKFAESDFSRILMACSGAAPMTKSTHEAVTNLIGKPVMSDIFGMTETGPCHTSNPVTAPKMGSVGLPCAGAKIRIRDVETGNQDMPLGEIGEICSAGPQLMKGYLGLPDESARALREIDGERWMFTGDVGYMDEDGYVFLCDRAKDMLVVGGFKVFSVEVEDKLAALPMVAGSAVIGTPDTRRPGNDIVNLYVALSPDYRGRDEDELRTELTAWIRENMAAYKVPKRVIFIDAIPLTPVGKIDKKKLRAEAMQSRP
ncbi:MAG: class I adenylate-forming enzyme family protein [Litorimonas sp.]